MSRLRHYAKNTLNRYAGLLPATLLALFVIQNLWQPGLPPGADLPIHLYRTMEYERAWTAGVIVPRWAPNLVYGYGYPLFIFAPPLPYMIGVGLHQVGLSFETALKLLLMGTAWLYAGGMYLLARDLLHSRAAGLVAAAAYLFAPFALREALLYGGNLPQYLAIGLFPWTLWAMVGAVRRRSWGRLVLAAACYAGVMLSHLFQAFIFTPVVAAFGLLLTGEAMRHGRRFSAWLPLLTGPLGLLLAAFFWLPAFVERYHTRAQADIYLERSPFYVRYPHWPELVAWIEPLDMRAANPYVPLSLGVVTLGLAGVGLACWAITAWLRADRRTPALYTLFFGLVALTATFLTLPVSRPVWETVSILQVAEFPWRMLGPANLGLAVGAGAALLLVPARLRWPAAIGCLLLQLGAIAPLLYPVIPFAHYGHASLADQVNYEHRSQSLGTTTVGEYMPRPVRRLPEGRPLLASLQAGEQPERLDRANLPPAVTAVRLEQTATTHRYRLTAPAPFTLRLYQFDFPGWRADLDGRPATIRPETETGLILVDIPAGSHTLTVHFGETPVRLIGLALTGLGLIGLMAGAVMSRRWRDAPQETNPSPWQGEARRGSSGGLFSAGYAPLAPLILALLLGLGLAFKPLLRPLFTVESPPEQALPAQYDTRIAFANGIRLIGYDLSRAVVRPGGYLQVTLYWQTEAAPFRVNLQPFVHLDRLDDFTTVADSTNYTPGDVTTETNMPTFHWDNYHYVRDEHDFRLPDDLPPLAYAVRAGLIDPEQGRLIELADGSGDTAQLTTVNVAPTGPEPPPLAHHLDISLSNDRDTIRLLGFERKRLTAERLDFRLAWQAEQPIQADYTVFAQLLDLDHNLMVSYDSPPLGGAYPTSTWLPGQAIRESRHIPLADVPPGSYRLIVGLYDPATGQRLKTPAGTDFVEVDEVEIESER